MTQIQVNLPDASSEFIQNQVASGKFSSASQYLGFLVEQARAQAAKQKLDSLLEEGLNSGSPVQFSAEWWQQRKAELLATLPPEARA